LTTRNGGSLERVVIRVYDADGNVEVAASAEEPDGAATVE
jgi:hypothetical protein